MSCRFFQFVILSIIFRGLIRPCNGFLISFFYHVKPVKMGNLPKLKDRCYKRVIWYNIAIQLRNCTVFAL